MFSARHIIVCLLFLTVLALSRALQETSYISRFVRECPAGQKLSGVRSTYKWFTVSRHSDRKWVFDCEPSGLSIYACYWTDEINRFDEDVNFRCENGIITGWEASGYGTYYGDRMFAFKCCLTEEKLRNEYKTGYLNGLRENFEYKVKNGQYITGIHSYHDNGKEDRRWEFDIKSL